MTFWLYWVKYDTFLKSILTFHFFNVALRPLSLHTWLTYFLWLAHRSVIGHLLPGTEACLRHALALFSSACEIRSVLKSRVYREGRWLSLLS